MTDKAMWTTQMNRVIAGGHGMDRGVAYSTLDGADLYT